MLAVLRIAHKYNMELVEEDILSHLKTSKTTSTFVDLMVASQIVDSQALYQQALQGLIKSNPSPDITEARRMGVDACHAVMSARNKHIVLPNQSVWIHCPSHMAVGTWSCPSGCHELVE